MELLVSLAAGLLLPLAPRQDPPAAQTTDAGEMLMQEVGAAFHELELALERRETETLILNANRLRGCFERGGALEVQKNAGLSRAFQRYLQSAAAGALELANLGTSGDIAQAGQALEEVRATCISCHAKFRADNMDLAPYPARRGAITGEVVVRTTSGVMREDRSNVVVFLDGGPPLSFPPPRRRPSLSQKDRRFEPRVLPVLRGTTVDFPNDDTVFHNVFSLSKDRPFDLGAYEQGCCESVDFPRSGLVLIHCNIHPQMVANIVVLENPYFTLTDEAGLFVLPEVPDGTYSLRTWHEYGGETREEVIVTGESMLLRSLQIKEQRVRLEHKNKFGQPYRDKYR